MALALLSCFTTYAAGLSIFSYEQRQKDKSKEDGFKMVTIIHAGSKTQHPTQVFIFKQAIDLLIDMIIS